MPRLQPTLLSSPCLLLSLSKPTRISHGGQLGTSNSGHAGVAHIHAREPHHPSHRNFSEAHTSTLINCPCVLRLCQIMLCQECSELVCQALSWKDDPQPETSKTRGRAKTVQEVLTAASHGCYICQLPAYSRQYSPIARRLREKSESWYLNTEFYVKKRDDSFHLFTCYAGLDDTDTPLGLVHDIALLPLADPSGQSAVWDHQIPTCTGNERVLGDVRRWLWECLQEHACCAQVQNSHTPLRLVDINPTRADERHFCVIETNAAWRRQPYLTLSHRWDADTPTLSNTTAHEYHRRNLWTKLPRTYQDAFAVVSALGFRYIWIDSLCISQDDRNGMLSEGLSMMQVYSGAVCNLSALKGEKGRMFATRHPSHVGSAQQLFNASHQNIQVRLADHNTWHSEVDEAPLNQRGWVLQERLLAARTLFFGKTQVLWECGLGRRCESYPILEPFSVSSQPSVLSSAGDRFYSVFRQIKPQSSLLQAEPNSSLGALKGPLSWEDLWWGLLDLYVPRAISFPRIDY